MSPKGIITCQEENENMYQMNKELNHARLSDDMLQKDDECDKAELLHTRQNKDVTEFTK